MPHDDGFDKVKNLYIKSEYYSICDDCGVNVNEVWMTLCAVFGDGTKTTKMSPPDNLMQWIISQSKVFSRKCLEKVVSSYFPSSSKIEYSSYFSPCSVCSTSL